MAQPRAHDGGGCGGGRAVEWARALAAETLATTLLVWLGLQALVPAHGESPPLTHPALAFGFVVTGCAVAFGPASGAHMNPAVTLAALLAGRMPAARAAAYALAQTLGAVLGCAALLATSPGATDGVGCTAPGPGWSPWGAMSLEAALTALLALACCSAWAAPPDPTVPLKLGLLVAGLIYAGGHATGASLNPARSFAPALLHGRWEHHWVYWLGPLGGAALAALLHRALLAPAPSAPSEPSAAPELERLQLADKP